MTLRTRVRALVAIAALYAVTATLDRLAAEGMLRADVVASLLSPAGLSVGRAVAALGYVFAHTGFVALGWPVAVAVAVAVGTWPSAKPPADSPASTSA